MAKMYQFGRKTVGPEACAMLQAIKRDKPALLWIQWNPTMVEPTRRGQVRTAVEFLSGLAAIQTEQGGAVLVEGKARDIPVRDEVFMGDHRLGKILGEPSHMFWCGLNIRHPGSKTLMCADHLVYATPRWPEKRCLCRKSNSGYRARSGEGYEQFCVCLLYTSPSPRDGLLSRMPSSA